MPTVRHRIVLRFAPEVTGEPVICKVTKDYDLDFNILRAEIGPDKEGRMVLDLIGKEESYRAAAKYLRDRKISVHPLDDGIHLDLERCVHCGACVGVCRAEALTLCRETMRVQLDASKCEACGECDPACPVNAIELALELGR